MTVPLRDLAECALLGAQSCIEATGHAKPVFLILQGNDVIVPMITEWHTDAQRAMALAAARQLMVETHATAYAHVYEGWTLPPAELAKLDLTVRPREHPARLDTLIIDAHNRDGQRITIFARLGKLPDGKRVVGVPEWNYGARTEMGSLCNLLEPEPRAN